MDRKTPPVTEAHKVTAQCRKQYGQAHDAHMSVNGECPWCGQSEEQDRYLTIEEAVRQYG